jgi:hypothetical protein
MLKNKFVLLGLLAILSLSACGIFHKGCGCPTFGSNVRIPNVQMRECANLLMCRFQMFDVQIIAVKV